MDSADDPDNRVEARSNIFVMGTLYCAGGSMPVRIRNMSARGALIEAGAPPDIGAQVRLGRASIQVTGEVVWAEARKAGLRFASAIALSDWLPTGKRGSGQQMIDEIFHQARLGPVPPRSDNGAPADSRNLPHEELAILQRLLEQAGVQLASDERIVANHFLALQGIDGAAQALARIAGQAQQFTPEGVQRLAV